MSSRTYFVAAIIVAVVGIGYLFATRNYGDPARATVEHERSAEKP